jgi:hypothetical protein
VADGQTQAHGPSTSGHPRNSPGLYLPDKRSLNSMTTSPETTQVPATPATFPWGPLLVLGFAWFLGVAIELSPSGLLTDIADDFQVSIATAGTLTTFYALGNALLVLPLTAFAPRQVSIARGTCIMHNVRKGFTAFSAVSERGE